MYILRLLLTVIENSIINQLLKMDAIQLKGFTVILTLCR